MSDSAPKPYFDEARWALFLKARQRRMLVLERGGDEMAAEVAFREHFVQATEEATNYVAQREVGSLLRDLCACWAKREAGNGK